MAELASELIARFGADRVLSGEGIAQAYECDAYTVDRARPSAVLLPTTADEVAEMVRWCHEREIPFVPRGSGTGLSGGALALNGAVLIVTKRMNRVLEVDAENRRALVQAGALNVSVSQAAAPFGLHFAPDPSSQTVSTVGGNVAANSGGPHCLKYGVTGPHVLGAKMVTFDGDVLEMGGAVPGGPEPDLLSLVIGSEGTVGILTELWLKLTPLPAHVETVLAAFPSARDATETVAAILAEGVVPAALEMMDRVVLGALRTAFGVDFHPDAEAVLIVECDGEASDVRSEMEHVERICQTKGALAMNVARDDAERKAIWTARKKGVGALGRIAPTLVTHDGVVPPSRLPDVLDKVYRIAEEFGLTIGNMFHAGDGNLHPICCFDDRNKEQLQAVHEAGHRILTHCVKMGGSVSGEHGIGVEKSELLRLMFDENDLELHRSARAAFHRSSLCNPGKLIPEPATPTAKLRTKGVAL